MTDDARAVLADPRAPADELFDARAELEASYRPAASDLIPASDLAPIIKAIQSGEAREELAKAAGAVVPFPSRGAPAGRRGAGSAAGPRSVRAAGPVGLGGAFVEKPGAVPFAALRSMVENTPILAAVVATRIRQVVRFCSPSEDGGPGFEIRHRDREHEASAADKARMAELSRFFQHCGWEWSPRRRKRLGRDAFAGFMTKLVRDSLAMDACPIETEWKRDRRRGVAGLYAVDGATVRLCTEEGYEGDDEVFALQVEDGRVAALYGHDDLIYEVRNPRTDLALHGYGFGETELLVRTVTAMLNAVSYNAEFFTANSVPKGLLQVFGDYGADDLAAFRRHWQQMIRGAGNRGLPVLVAKDKESGATYTPVDNATDEMAFAKWLTFLTSVVCAVYGVDPAEIGFDGFAAAKSSLSGEDTGEKMASARDKGFRPLMSFLEGTLTDFVVTDFDPDLCFRWTGLEEEDKARTWEAKKLIATVDELRAEEGYGPHPDPRIGALPVNPALIAPAMQFMAPAPGAGDFGPAAPEPAAPGDDFGGEAAPAPAEPGDDFGKALMLSLSRIGAPR